MSACEPIQALLAEWIADELDEVSAAGVRAHLAACAACRTEEAEMREVLALLESEKSEDGLGGVSDPGDPYWAGFASRVSARVERPAAKPASSNVVWLFERGSRLAVAALAAAAVLVLALRMPWPSASDSDAQLAALLASPAAEGIGEVLAPPSSDAIAGLAPEDLDLLGEQLASAPDDAGDVEDLDDLSPELLEQVLERLDAT